MTSVIGVNHKRLLSVPVEMQVHAECQRLAANLRVIFTELFTSACLDIFRYTTGFPVYHYAPFSTPCHPLNMS